MKQIPLKGKYYEGASEEIINAIRARVSMIEEKILLYREISDMIQFSVKLMFNELLRLSNQFDSCGYLINLEETKVPDALTRRKISEAFDETLINVKHVCFVTGRNFIINTAARFAIYQTNVKSFSIHKYEEEALKKLKNILHES